MNDIELTQRQIKLLKAILSEFMDTAEAVGSSHLPTKYNIKVSPATIRNEMMQLGNMGLLSKSHVSSGRKPTSRAFRFFIDELLDDLEEIKGEREAKIRETIFQHRFSVDRLLYEAVRKLNEITNNISIAVFEDRVYHSGICELVNYPEYQQHRRLKSLLQVLEDVQTLTDLFQKHAQEDNDVYILIGKDDTGLSSFERTSIVFGKLYLHGNQVGYLAVIGPDRIDYSQVIPSVKWMIKTVNKSVQGW
ncbi:hypothetical protein GF362_02365 [Candidatus Dojkabacteria bacterium]|nr:hypothetical protein [Candidatus Dojkabacteria bacterium]